MKVQMGKPAGGDIYECMARVVPPQQVYLFRAEIVSWVAPQTAPGVLDIKIKSIFVTQRARYVLSWASF